MRRTIGARPFDYRLAVVAAQARLSMPPLCQRSRRIAPIGQLVAAFALPFESDGIALCPPTNGTRRKPNWWYVRQRDELWMRLFPQFLKSGLVRGSALPGRPQIRAVRFGSEADEPDPYADWAKSAIDRFILPLRIRRKGRLVDCKRWGFLQDDDEAHSYVCQWWELSEMQFAYFEIRSGYVDET